MIASYLKPLTLVLIFIPALAFAEPYKDRVQKQEYIKEHGGVRHESGVKTQKNQVEFGEAKDYKKTFDRAEKNAGTRSPKVVIDAPQHWQDKIKSDARKRGIEVEFEEK